MEKTKIFCLQLICFSFLPNGAKQLKRANVIKTKVSNIHAETPFFILFIHNSEWRLHVNKYFRQLCSTNCTNWKEKWNIEFDLFFWCNTEKFRIYSLSLCIFKKRAEYIFWSNFHIRLTFNSWAAHMIDIIRLWSWTSAMMIFARFFSFSSRRCCLFQKILNLKNKFLIAKDLSVNLHF